MTKLLLPRYLTKTSGLPVVPKDTVMKVLYMIWPKVPSFDGSSVMGDENFMRIHATRLRMGSGPSLDAPELEFLKSLWGLGIEEE